MSLKTFIVICLISLFIFGVGVNVSREGDIRDMKQQTVERGENVAVQKEITSYISTNRWDEINSHSSNAMVTLVLKNINDDDFKLLIYHDLNSSKFHSFALINGSPIEEYAFGIYPKTLPDDLKEDFEDVSNDMIIKTVDTDYDELIGYCNETEQIRILQDTRSDDRYLLYTRNDTLASALYSVSAGDDGKATITLITYFYRNEKIV